MEIERLHKMLTEAGIAHQWIDRTPPDWLELVKENDSMHFLVKDWGYQIKLDIEEPFFSAIEGFGSYGYGIRGEQGDSIEIMLGDEVYGRLTAEEVFKVIKDVLEDNFDCTRY